MWNFSQFGSHIALQNAQGERLTYQQLTDIGHALCHVMQKRTLVFCLCENSIGSALGYFSFVENGIVPALLSNTLSPSLLDALVDTYHPAYFWLPEGQSFRNYPSIFKTNGYHLLQSPYGNEAVLHDDLALLLTTSGSTGSPKFVRQSYRNIQANMVSIADYLHLDQNERPITTLPMSYTYGLSILQSHAYVGATLLITDAPITTRAFWDFAKAEKATSFGGVPYTYEMLDRMRFFRMDLPHLTTLTQAGGKLLPALHEKFATWCAQEGKQFIVMYGQCEATARMAYLPWEKALDKIGAMGIAIPGGTFVLMDTEEKPIHESGVTGELRYYGDNVTLGYSTCRADLAKGDERFGMLDTGDMAQVDEDGYYSIVGRKKRFLKLFGNRVNVDEVERILKNAFPSQEIACLGHDDHLIICATQADELPAMRNHLIAQTNLPSQGFFTQTVPYIPKNDAGKVTYTELERLL